MGMKEIIKNIDIKIWDGEMFATPGETEKERRSLKGYCSQSTVDNCEHCGLVNYGLDCHNNKIETGLSRSTSRDCAK